MPIRKINHWEAEKRHADYVVFALCCEQESFITEEFYELCVEQWGHFYCFRCDKKIHLEHEPEIMNSFIGKRNEN